jgi:transcription termination factor Rho
MLSNLSEQRGLEAMEAVLQQMSKTADNAEFLANLNRSLA